MRFEVYHFTWIIKENKYRISVVGSGNPKLFVTLLFLYLFKIYTTLLLPFVSFVWAKASDWNWT